MEKRKINQTNLLVKECMVTAFIQLLKEKPLSCISISELTKRAGVSRMTYYRNYQSKEDILSSHLTDVLDEYHAEFKQLPEQGNFSDIANLRHCFTYLRKHDDFLCCLFQSGLGHLFLEKLTKYITDTWCRPDDDRLRLYILPAFAGSLYNLYITSSNDNTVSDDILISILHSIYKS